MRCFTAGCIEHASWKVKLVFTSARGTRYPYETFFCEAHASSEPRIVSREQITYTWGSPGKLSRVS